MMARYKCSHGDRKDAKACKHGHPVYHVRGNRYPKRRKSPGGKKYAKAGRKGKKKWWKLF